MADIKFRIRAQDDTKSGTEDAEKSFAKMEAGIAKAAAGIAVAIGAFKLLFDFGKKAVQGYVEQEKAVFKLEAILKSTGNAVGMTSKQLQQLAGNMQSLTGIEDDVIINSEAIMLTFTSIGKEVFPEAIRTAADLSAALGQDMQSSVIQLGKALNDPIQGVTALRRVGVSFSQSQLDLIRRLQETGDVLGAQKVVLAELEKEFGGVAEAMGQTTAGKLERIKRSFEEITDTIGKMLIDIGTPILESTADFLNKNGQTIQGFFANIPQIASTYWQLSQDIMKEALQGKNAIRILGAFGKNFIDVLINIVKFQIDAANLLVGLLTAPFKALGAWLGSFFANVWANIQNTGIDALNGLLGWAGVNLKKADIPKMMGIEEVWDVMISEGEKSFSEFAKNTGDTFSNIGKSFSKTGDLLSEIFGPKIDAANAKAAGIIDTWKAIQNATESATESVTKYAGAISAIPIQEQAGSGAYAHGTTAGGGHEGGGTQNAPGASILDFVKKPLEDFGSALFRGFESVEAFSGVMNWADTIVSGVMEIIGGPLQEALQPIIVLLKYLGQILGSILLPVVKFLGAVIKGVATFIASIFNAIATVINFLLGWAGVHIKTINVGSMGGGESESGALDNGSGGGSMGYSGASASTAAPVYNVNVNVYAGVVNAGDKLMTFDDLCIFIRDRTAQLAEDGR
jgi:hypothetical protein